MHFLAEIWSKREIDGHSTVAEYIPPKTRQLQIEDTQLPSDDWVAKHVLQSQYCLQVSSLMFVELADALTYSIIL
jgi:hypothetical protein